MESENDGRLCAECRWKGCKRCDICSRRYSDRFERKPPPEPVRKAAALILMEALTLVLGSEEGGYGK